MISQSAAIALILILSLGSLGAAAEELSRFSLPALKGRTVRSEELKDKIVVLDFWATWCENCVSEIHEFNKLEKEY